MNISTIAYGYFKIDYEPMNKQLLQYYYRKHYNINSLDFTYLLTNLNIYFSCLKYILFGVQIL